MTETEFRLTMDDLSGFNEFLKRNDFGDKILYKAKTFTDQPYIDMTSLARRMYKFCYHRILDETIERKIDKNKYKTWDGFIGSNRIILKDNNPRDFDGVDLPGEEPTEDATNFAKMLFMCIYDFCYKQIVTISKDIYDNFLHNLVVETKK